MEMIRRRFGPWQQVMALAPALLLLVYLPGEMLLRCRIDGLLRPACCCAHQSEKQGRGPVVKAQDCCDREVTRNQRPTAEATRAESRDDAPLAVVAFVAATDPLLAKVGEAFDRPVQRHGPSREGPRLVLLKQAFLI